MNTLLLQPTDVLFFRDGRPMGGSLSGHAAAWPLPTVTNAAVHAALHRADLEKKLGGKLHGHDHHRRNGERITDVRKFGSLITAGPYPVLSGGRTWLFPRPLDAGLDKGGNDCAAATLLPLAKGFSADQSSLPEPLRYALANENGPTKKAPSTWWNAAAWENYLGTSTNNAAPEFHEDADFADTEFSYGIGMNTDTGTQDGERFYSAHYLRLKPDARLGLLAEARDKINSDPNDKRDLIPVLFPNSGTRTPVIVGGQQRLCTVEAYHRSAVPLPKGKCGGFKGQDPEGKDIWLVKWALLSPAIFPAIQADPSKGITAHPGGWLPNWICQQNGAVLLKAGDTSRRERESREAWRQRVRSEPVIPATLVGAVVGKPVPVTGYALPNNTDPDRTEGGPKPTHLAVGAGSVYYFTCDSEDAAAKLAGALNWHGKDDFNTIRNRRSTLFGEKGFGLGVCGTWQFHSGNLPTT
ncbi:type III-B CRISPR module-associated Cmr3 family protein [Prosthecobacter sp.]|jgi:hypothetical protein|uniref:type III-B CRISPR module-associated Cmr3 family protein n=1 Tax=Prosthecobacter sp. TaxID=1965333 RepID=UPI003784203D